MNITCPANYPSMTYDLNFKSNETCPEYFRWIHEDLKIWKEKGITREMVESLQDNGTHFRLVIMNGIAYVKQYGKAYQTRDTYTLWGILQLLKLYPGRLPDLDLVFQCHDLTTIKKDDYKGTKAAFAPPQFHYCGDDSTYDIVFPDWSFWGWPEINIKPWVPLLKDFKEGNLVKNWTSREPYAFWKGNVYIGPRRELKKCNSTNDWNVVIVKQDWRKEEEDGFRNSNLSKQCSHRSLIPMVHYWPANPDNLCHSIKCAVDWGNKNTPKAQEIGKAGSKFIFDQIKMENVYDYMFHLLNEYAKLLKYRPTIPEGAIELCSEKFACSPMGLEATFKKETMVNGPSEHGPCKLPPPYDSNTLEAILDRNAKIKQVVEMWEKGSA
uniref:Glycosyl transferase CAP10 domain-containing protein n=1 Tax=Chenopodium quinoa TaxID=63459 RepID=A0A803MPV6_CHEQI